MKKKLSILFLLLIIGVCSFAQSSVGMKKIVPFKMTLSNGKAFSATQLPPGPVVLIFFSPDCEHCQDFTKDMLKNFSAVGSKQVVMITPQSMEMLKPFVTNYNLAVYPNIKVGVESAPNQVQRYYQIGHYPFIALYDKTGKLVKTFEGEQPHAEIFKAIRGI